VVDLESAEATILENGTNMSIRTNVYAILDLLSESLTEWGLTHSMLSLRTIAQRVFAIGEVLNRKYRGVFGVVMSTAFVLIKTAPQRELDVYLTLLNLEAVTETHVSYGEYDLVARIDFDDEKEMAKTLIGQMRSIEGVIRTETLIAVEV
tara:strand:- start:772 stop:1221 length:450 start_codon:yes stop_codon:yes gene_type:complete